MIVVIDLDLLFVCLRVQRCPVGLGSWRVLGQMYWSKEVRQKRKAIVAVFLWEVRPLMFLEIARLIQGRW